MTDAYFKSLLKPGFISSSPKDEKSVWKVVDQLKKENADLKAKIALLEDECERLHNERE